APHVRRHGLMLTAEVRELRAPLVPELGEPVDEQDQRAAAHRHVVQPDPVDLGIGVVHRSDALGVTSHITGKTGRGSRRTPAAARRATVPPSESPKTPTSVNPRAARKSITRRRSRRSRKPSVVARPPLWPK